MKFKARHSLILPFLLLMLSTSGCFSSTKYSVTLTEEPIETHYGDLALSGEVRDRWWEAYGDSALNEFVELVLSESPTLQVAYLKLLDNQLSIKQSNASYYPTLNFSAGAGYGGQVSSDGSSSDPSYSLGLSLSYEIDLWGKVRAQKLVNELTMQSAQDSAESAALTLVGNVVTNWFAIQYYRDRRVMTEQLLQISEDYYALVQDYYRTGQSDAMDVLEQRQQLESLRSTLSDIDSNIRITQNSLAIFAGGKAHPTVEGSLPEAIDVGGTIDASKLVETRPDLRTALRNAQKADAQVVIALANRLPSLKLSASLSFRSSSITELFKKLIWDLAANFSANLFDGFQKTTAIEKARVSYISEKFSYMVSVMQAVAEVEQAILKLHLKEQSLADARAQLERQKEILEVSRTLYVNGNLAYNRVLSALKSMISASQSELDARRALLLAQIDLFKAMGGSTWLQETSKKGAERANELLEQLKEEEK